MEREMHLFDDEEFTLADNIKRRKFFQPLLPGADLSQRPQNVTSINLTGRHFACEGATQLHHLNTETYDLVNMLFNAFAFATGKKKRIGAPGGSRGRSTHPARSSAVVSAEAGEGEAPPQSDVVVEETDRNQFYYQGDAFLRMVLETLLQSDERGLRVVGLRVWIFDSSTEGNALDLLTRGLQECLLEAQMMQREIKAELERHGKSQPRKTTTPQKGVELKQLYHASYLSTYPMFRSLAANYFANDDLLLQHRCEGDEEEEDKEDQVACFIDRRTFLRHNADRQDGPVNTREECATLPLLYSKEQAMFYHVEKAGVAPHQRCLTSYFADNREDIAEAMERQERDLRSVERLSTLFAESVEDRYFHGFPFPSVTYRVENEYVSAELLSQMPLPHRVGTYLYTTANRSLVSRRIRTAMTTVGPSVSFAPDVDEDEDEEEDSVSARGGVAPLGLHDVEVEVTAELFHTYPQFTSEETVRALSGESYVLTENTKASFMNQARNAVHLAVLATAKTVSETKRTYLVEQGRKVDGKEETVAGLVHNADKQYALDRRIYAVIGRGDAAQLKDRQKMLSSCNMAYYRSVIGRWRPIAATVANVITHCRNVKYDTVFLERDIYWVLDSLNEHGFANLDRKYYNPETGKVRRGQLQAYLADKWLFIQAITAEFFTEFFNNQRVSVPNVGIRDDLKKGTSTDGRRKGHRLGIKLSLMKYDKQVLPFHAYMLWVQAFFTESCLISRLFKPMNILFHAKLHHARTFTPESRDPKNEVTMLGKGAVGKSHLLSCARQSCPTDVCLGVSHFTTQCHNVDQNISDFCMIHDEMSCKIVGRNDSNKNNAGHSDAGQDDARNNYKEMATSHQSTTMYYHKDEETGDRKMKIAKAQNQYVSLNASNVNREEIDPNVLSRMICISVARSLEEKIGQRPQDKNRLELGVDGEIVTQQLEEVREVHRLHYMMECMMKSGIFQNRRYGVAITAAQIYLGKFLDLLSAKYGINTNNIRKRTFILEMARSICVHEKCWWVAKSPEERHLYHDPYTKEYIGLNPRVLLEGVGKHLVVSKHHVVMAITMLSCLWGHEQEDAVLETFAIKKCHLDQLKAQNFLHREPAGADVDNASTAATALNNQVDRRRRASYYPAMGGGTGMDAPEAEKLVVDYNYITMTMKSHADIHSLLEVSMGDTCISASEIAHILREYSKQFLQCDGYVMREEQYEEVEGEGDEVRSVTRTRRRLVRSNDPDQSILRKIVDYGKAAGSGPVQYSIAISVAFLKQKLSHLLPDSLIEDLAIRQYSVAPVEREEGEEEDSTVHEMEEDAEVEVRDESSFHERLQKLLSIQKNSSNDIYITKAIREVLEHDILEWTGEQTTAEEADDQEDYADVMTGKLPWMCYVTADCPPSVKTEALFPELMAEYSRIPGHTKEILLVDKLAVLELERKKGCKPFVTYNFNTATPSARSSLSVYNSADADEAEEEENYYAEQGETPEARERRHRDREQQEVANREQLLVIAKNRFKMYSDTPVFFSTVDLDYDECRTHLLHMAYPQEIAVGKNGRLCNYEPHMYMNMMDYRDRRERRTGKRMPLVPLYADVMEKLSTTRKIIEASVNRTPEEDRRTYTMLCQANYEEADLGSLAQATVRERRSLEQRHARGDIRREVQDSMDKRYRIIAEPDKNPRPGKRTRKGK